MENAKLNAKLTKTIFAKTRLGVIFAIVRVDNVGHRCDGNLSFSFSSTVCPQVHIKKSN